MAEGPSDAKRPALAVANSMRSKGVKRKQPTIYSGKKDVPLNRDSSRGLVCPICFSIIESAYMTECGHSFCQKCIETCMEKRNQCPKCNSTIHRDKLFPNFTLNEVILRHKQKTIHLQNAASSSCIASSSGNGIVTELFTDVLDNKISYENVSSLIDILQQKRKCLLLESEIGNASLTLEFLSQIKTNKEKQLKSLEQELNVISSDMDTVRYITEY